MLGKNKEPIKTPKKNIIPPFDDERWYPSSNSVSEIKRNGYSMSFKTMGNSFHRMQCELDAKLVAGKKLFFSVADRTTEVTSIQFNIETDSGWTYHGNTKDLKGSVEVPFNVKKVLVLIQGQNAETYHYVENLQVEIGMGATSFEERLDVNKLPKRGLKFIGGSRVSGASGYLSSERDYSMEAEFTPLPSALSSSFSAETIVFGWQGDHQGILYDRSTQRIRIQNIYRNNVSEKHERDIFYIDSPLGRKINVLVTFNAEKREQKIYINKALVHTSVKFQDKETYSHRVNGSYLLIGGMNNASYDYSFSGIIEMARYWNRALTDDEVMSGERISYGLVDEYDFRDQDVDSKTIKNTAGSVDGAIRSLNEGCNPYYIQKEPVDNKIAKSSPRKMSFKRYPFNFKRESKATLDSVDFGINQPRISSNGGIIVEDGYENIIPLSKSRNFTSGWATHAGSTVVCKKNQIVEEWNANDATRITTSGGTSTVKYFTSIVTPSVTGQHYSLGVYVKNIGENTVEVQDNIGSAVRVLPKEVKWVSMSGVGNGRSNFQLHFSTLSNRINDSLDFIAWRPQAIAGQYLPTYAEFSRDKEYLAIPNIGEYFDNEKGSLELELMPLNSEGVNAKSIAYHDLSYYETKSGFILRRYPAYIEYVVSNEDGTHSGYTTSFSFKNGESIKYRLEWNRKENKSKLFVNGVQKIGSATCFCETFKNMAMHIGCRGMNHAFSNGNAIYKSLRIRNRYGQTVYKL